MAISNRKGIFYLHTGAIMLVVAMIGCWYLYRSFQAGNLKNDFASMVGDCQQIASQVDMSAADRYRMDKAFSTIREIAARNNVNVVIPLNGRY